MNSKIRIEHDFSHNESFITLNLEEGDNNDKALKFFVEQANNRGVELIYPRNNQDNKTIYIRPMIAQEQELYIVRAFKQMCEESTPPELTLAFDSIYTELFRNRQALKGKEDLIL